MEIVANSLNGVWTRELVNWEDSDALVSIDLAVAYTSRLDDLLKLSSKRGVSLASSISLFSKVVGRLSLHSGACDRPDAHRRRGRR